MNERQHAHTQTAAAIKSGALARRPCEGCGAEPAQAHHDDYRRPLDVRWLCSQCHYQWHAANQAQPPPPAPQWQQGGNDGHVTVSQAAALLGIHRDTMQRYVRDGVVKADRVNDRLYLIHISEVERLEKDHNFKRGRPRKPPPN